MNRVSVSFRITLAALALLTGRDRRTVTLTVPSSQTVTEGQPSRST
jgi:hypothetical protein